MSYEVAQRVESITVVPPLSREIFEEHRNYSRELGLPTVDELQLSGKLAVVGSGPSTLEHLDELLRWKGGIWAINGAWRFLNAMKIYSTFFSIDPLPIIVEYSKGAKEAILASQCDPRVFGMLIGDGAEVTLFDWEGSVGTSSAMGAAFAAPRAGFSEIHFFGCECSYPPEKMHIHMEAFDPDTMVVEVGGEEFLTRGPYLQQALELSNIIAQFPRIFKEHSGGLLRSLSE